MREWKPGEVLIPSLPPPQQSIMSQTHWTQSGPPTLQRDTLKPGMKSELPKVCEKLSRITSPDHPTPPHSKAQNTRDFSKTYERHSSKVESVYCQEQATENQSSLQRKRKVSLLSALYYGTDSCLSGSSVRSVTSMNISIGICLPFPTHSGAPSGLTPYLTHLCALSHQPPDQGPKHRKHATCLDESQSWKSGYRRGLK